jgi:hypothetical protein
MTRNEHMPDGGLIGRLFAGYAEEPRPLTGYLMLVGTFNAIFAGALLLIRSRRQSATGAIRFRDLLLLGVATHKVSRLLTKDSVLSPLRAPFTTYEGQADLPGEVDESPRDDGGVRHAIGELLNCPFCSGQWVAAFFTYGLMLWPRATRLVASIFTVPVLSNLLNAAYQSTLDASSQAPELLEKTMGEAAAGDD